MYWSKRIIGVVFLWRCTGILIFLSTYIQENIPLSRLGIRKEYFLTFPTFHPIISHKHIFPPGKVQETVPNYLLLNMTGSVSLGLVPTSVSAASLLEPGQESEVILAYGHTQYWLVRDVGNEYTVKLKPRRLRRKNRCKNFLNFEEQMSFSNSL